MIDPIVYIMLFYLAIGFGAYKWGMHLKKDERARRMRCSCRKCMEWKEHIKSEAE